MNAQATGSPALDVVYRFFAAINAKDVDEFDAMITDDSKQDVPFNESGAIEWDKLRRAEGREAVLEYWRIAFEKEPTQDVRIEDIHEVPGERIVYAEATSNNVMLDGSPYRNRYIFRFDITEDGRIERVREYYNPVNTSRAFGRPITA